MKAFLGTRGPTTGFGPTRIITITVFTDTYFVRGGNIRGAHVPEIGQRVTVDGSCRASIGAGRAWPAFTGWAERPRMTATSRSGKRLKQPRIVNT